MPRPAKRVRSRSARPSRSSQRKRLLALAVCGVCAASGAFFGAAWLSENRAFVRGVIPEVQRRMTRSQAVVRRVEVHDEFARRIVEAAHAQKGDVYDASYRTISFPGGDVPEGRGACTDVVIRALRGANYDLQSRVHADMKRDFGRYPKLWGLKKPNSSIDHRRVPNLMTFFDRHAQKMPLQTTGEALKTWQPGDIVCWQLLGNKWHIGVVSDGVGTRAMPLVIHNGWKCVEQDYLDAWPVIGHYRVRQQASQNSHAPVIRSS